MADLTIKVLNQRVKYCNMVKNPIMEFDYDGKEYELIRSEHGGLQLIKKVSCKSHKKELVSQ